MNTILNVQKLSRTIDTIFENKISDVDMSRGQYIYILYLYENSGSNQLDISQNLLLDKTTVAKALKRLEKDHYIIRRVDSRDKRKVKVFLTQKGKDVYHEIQSIFKEISEKLSTQIRPTYQKELNKIVQLYIQELELSWSKIKNYKKKETFELGTIKEKENIEIRRAHKFSDTSQVFVKKRGNYILNYLEFEEDNNNIFIDDIELHNSESQENDDSQILNEFLNWFYNNKKGNIYFRTLDSDTIRQRFAIKEGFYFNDYEPFKNGYRYIYDKLKNI